MSRANEIELQQKSKNKLLLEAPLTKRRQATQTKRNDAQETNWQLKFSLVLFCKSSIQFGLVLCFGSKLNSNSQIKSVILNQTIDLQIVAEMQVNFVATLIHKEKMREREREKALVLHVDIRFGVTF